MEDSSDPSCHGCFREAFCIDNENTVSDQLSSITTRIARSSGRTVPEPLRGYCKDYDRHVLNDVLAREIGPDGGHFNGEYMVFEELGVLMKGA